MHYSRHRPTASVTYVTTLTYASTNDRWPRPLAYWSIRQKPNRVSSVQFSSVQLRRSVRALTEMHVARDLRRDWNNWGRL